MLWREVVGGSGHRGGEFEGCGLVREMWNGVYIFK